MHGINSRFEYSFFIFNRQNTLRFLITVLAIQIRGYNFRVYIKSITLKAGNVQS